MAELNWRSAGGVSQPTMPGRLVDTKVDKDNRWAHDAVSAAAPLFKALTIILIYIVNNLGYSPIGCKTRYLFSNKFWYNKQLVIFFVIYFVINLRSSAARGGATPNDLFVVSLIVWILYNVTTRLGETWAVMSTPLWPGPLTWFGMLTFPLIVLFIVNDARKYYISVDKTNAYDTTIRTLYYAEICLMLASLGIMGTGFVHSYIEQSRRWGKDFSFLRFFFGIENDANPAMSCDTKDYARYDKEIRAASRGAKGATSLFSVLPELSIVVAVLLLASSTPRILSAIRPLFETQGSEKISTHKSWKSAMDNM